MTISHISNGESGSSARTKLNLVIDSVNEYLELVVPISSAELLALNSSPKQIIPAPGAGKVIRLLYWFMTYTFGSAPYSGPDSPYLGYQGSALFHNNASYVSDNIFSRSANALGYGYGASTSQAHGTLLRSEVENKALMLIDDNDYTVGDGTAVLTVKYTIETLP